MNINLKRIQGCSFIMFQMQEVVELIQMFHMQVIVELIQG